MKIWVSLIKKSLGEVLLNSGREIRKSCVTGKVILHWAKLFYNENEQTEKFCDEQWQPPPKKFWNPPLSVALPQGMKGAANFEQFLQKRIHLIEKLNISVKIV